MDKEKENTKNIYQRIRDIMCEVKGINKESKKVNNQYTFVSHDAVAKALHDPLTRHGVVMLPNVTELTQSGNRTCAKVEVKFVNVDNPEESVTVTYWGYGIDPQDKGVGKAISYAVKYCLLKTFCLETGDDVEKDSIDFKADTSIVTLEEVQLIREKCNGNKEALQYLEQNSGGLEKLERSRLVGVLKWIENPENKFFKQKEIVSA